MSSTGKDSNHFWHLYIANWKYICIWTFHKIKLARQGFNIAFLLGRVQSSVSLHLYINSFIHTRCMLTMAISTVNDSHWGYPWRIVRNCGKVQVFLKCHAISKRCTHMIRIDNQMGCIAMSFLWSTASELYVYIRLKQMFFYSYMTTCNMMHIPR